jgi:putative transcriptional regulator
MKIRVALDEHLKRRDKSYYWLAKESGVAHNTLARLRHDQAKGIEFDTLAKICVVLECAPGDLLVKVPDSMKVRQARKSPTSTKAVGE